MRHPIRCWIVLAGALLVLLGSTVQARAEGEVELSSDGETWRSDHPAALFDEAVRWVPGDERSESFWVRNATDEPAEFRVEVLDLRGRALLDRGDVVLEFALDGAPVEAEEDTFGVPETSAGQVVQVTATVGFAATAGNDTQGESVAFDLRVSLTQATADAGTAADGAGDDGAGDDEAGGLGDTGAQAGLIAVLVIGTLAVLGGVLLLVRRRISRPDQERKP